MAIFFDEIAVSGMPALGDLIGSSVSSDLFTEINRNNHINFFGEELTNMRTQFMDRYVRPMDEVRLQTQQMANLLTNPDRIRALLTIEDFRVIPPSMELPIVLFAPVRQAIIEGRMEGFGWEPTSLPEDVFGRLIDNDRCDDVLAASDAQGYYTTSSLCFTDDPEISDDELFDIRRTRQYIEEKLLRETDRDPTNIDSCRG